MIAQGLQFSDAKDHIEILMGMTLYWGTKRRWGRLKLATFKE